MIDDDEIMLVLSHHLHLLDDMHFCPKTCDSGRRDKINRCVENMESTKKRRLETETTDNRRVK
jgi:hypothetical protein